METSIKRCIHCHELKMATSEYFAECSKAKDGLNAYCKKCMHQYYKEWRKNNVERAREISLDYYHRHKQICDENNKKWAKRNPDKVKARQKRYHDTERYKAINRRHRHQRRILEKEADCYTDEDINKQYIRQKMRCYYCGKTIKKTYEIDHIIPVSRGGTNHPSNIVLACKSCNASKKDKLLHEWIKGGRLL